MATLEDKSVDCCITSPPYWQLRDYGWTGQWGLEKTYQEYLEHLWQFMDVLWVKLKDTGTVWINLGDTFGTTSGNIKQGNLGTNKVQYTGSIVGYNKPAAAHKCLLMLPSRFAIGCIDRGWTLRNDVIWCLSGGTRVYARTQKGVFPQTIKDLARLKTETVELWNGDKWTKVKGFYKNETFKNPIEIELRSGEKIACTQTHRFPTNRGLLPAGEIRKGDVLTSCQLPNNDIVNSGIDDELLGWFIGVYIAEGSRSENTIQISGHIKETERYEKVKRLCAMYDGISHFYKVGGNKATINITSKVLNAFIDEYVSGYGAYKKRLSNKCWRRSNVFMNGILMGYLDGDGHYDKKNNRYRLGFCLNYGLADDLRTVCARVGADIRLRIRKMKFKDAVKSGFKGEIRFEKSAHHNNKSSLEVMAINKSRGRCFWDIEVEDEPHLFSLSSGVLTHNSKPNGMPESVTDRLSKKHEHIFLLVKQQKYYFDLDGIKSKSAPLNRWGGPKLKANGKSTWDEGTGQMTYRDRDLQPNDGMKNPGDVWTVNTKPSSLNHYASYNSELIDRPIIAGCPEYVCKKCGKPREKIYEERETPTTDTHKYQAAATISGGGKSKNFNGGSARAIIGLTDCGCNAGFEGGLILDPFCGTGTTIRRAKELGRRGIGIEGNPEYVKIAQRQLDAVSENMFAV